MRISLSKALVKVAMIGMATTLSYTALPSLALSNEVQASPASTARMQATELTQALMGLQKKWANTQGAGKARVLEQLVAKAEERHAFLTELVKSNPAEALRVAIPEDKQLGMPSELRSMFLQRLETEGELETLFEDYEDGTHKLRHFLKSPFGERFELHFTGKHPELPSGSQVGVNALFLENGTTDADLLVDSDEDSILTLAIGGTTDGSITGATPTAELSNTFGEKRTLVFLVNFQDKAEQPYTQQEAQDLVFGQASDFFMENSDDQAWLSGDVTGWYTLPMSSTTCDYGNIATLAQDAAAQQGVNTSGYDRYMYVFPKNACSWSGLGTVGGSPGTTWINGSFRLNIVAHELGHNYGLYHAKAEECGADSIGDSCSIYQYGDLFDTMGNRYSAHFNAFQKARLGWLNGLVTAESDGTYVLEPYETAPGNSAKALRVLKGIDSSTGQKSWYYMEYRQAIGFDDFLSTNDNVQNGVIIHTATDSDGDSSHLLDMTPDSDPWYDWDDPALVSGDSFTDTDAGVTISTLTNDGGSVTVEVAMGPQPCVTAAPSLSLSPSVSSWVAPGSTVTYTATVTNNDSANCSSASIAMTADTPSGWSSVLSNNTLSLAPGESASVELDVTSATTAADGYYDVALTAASADQASTATATYVVSAPKTNNAPTANNDSGETLESASLVLAVLDNDSDPDGDSLSVSSVTNSANGSVSMNADGTITYQPNDGFTGTDSFEYTVTDGQADATATVSIAVTAQANSAPIANDDSATTSKGSAVTISVLGNDHDPDDDLLTVTSVTQGAKGTVSINADGTLTYTAAKNFNSTDSFSYTISDGTDSASATVVVSPDSSSSDSTTTGKGNGKGGPNK